MVQVLRNFMNRRNFQFTNVMILTFYSVDLNLVQEGLRNLLSYVFVRKSDHQVLFSITLTVTVSQVTEK